MIGRTRTPPRSIALIRFAIQALKFVPPVCPQVKTILGSFRAVSKSADVYWAFVVPRGGIEPPTP